MGGWTRQRPERLRSPRTFFTGGSTGFTGALACFLAAACGPGEEASVPPPHRARFPDEAAERGLTYTNLSGEPHKPTLLEANGAGCALFDLGADGDLDALFGQGVSSVLALTRGEGSRLSVFENDGRGHFRRLPDPETPASGWWTGLASGDIDGDGRADIVAAGFGVLSVLLQDEDEPKLTPHPGGFLSEAERFPPGGAGSAAWSTSMALFDADGDGELDLYVGRYVAFDAFDPPLGELAGGPGGDDSLGLPCMWKGIEVFCGPRGMAAQPDGIFRGRGDGSFENKSEAWLGAQEASYTLGVAAFDADLDGATDLFVAADSEPNRLYVNALGARGRFEERGYAAGVAVNPDGLSEAGMGIAVGDVNRDGLFDLAVTNFSDEPTQLYLGAGIGFRCASYRSGLAHATRPFLSWGAHLVDFTGDGGLELFTANGHVYPQADRAGTYTSYLQLDTLFAFDLDGAGRARRLTPEGELFTVAGGSRGSAVGDVDGDGAPDLLVTRIDGPCALAMNRLDPRAHRLAIRCLGSGELGPANRKTPADGMGTRVLVHPLARDGGAEARRPWVGEVQTSGGFQSASSPWLYFGLGTEAAFEGLVLLWPSGRREELEGGPADRRLWIREGRGIVREGSF
ncbi:MAG: hypothetical protein CMJ89_17890 [Planctomycetes bacterium]|nr:hypothetical protein [Planctomycetota bacterium]